MPSRVTKDGDRDGIPNVLLEAMATELPVIATKVSGIPEVIISDSNGLLVPPENHIELAKNIRYALKNPACCKRWGKAARKTVIRNFSAQNNIDLIYYLLLETMDKSENTVHGSTPVRSENVL
jgi:glycosyltransferase involved in cell wall biosynthesis